MTLLVGNNATAGYTANGLANGQSGIRLVHMDFVASVSGTATDLFFYSRDNNGNNVRLCLYSAAGALLAYTAGIANGEGWISAALNTSVAIASGTTYKLGWYTDVGYSDYYTDNGGSGALRDDTGSYTAPAATISSTADGGIQRFLMYADGTTGGGSAALAGAPVAVATATGTLTPNQSAAPIATISAGAWVPSTGGSLYAMLDEVAADDGDYITAPVANSVAEVRLASMNDPLASSSHTLRYRISSPVSASIRLTVMQGATQIAQWTEATTPSLTTYSHTLSGAEADAITDYTDLRVRIEAL